MINAAATVLRVRETFGLDTVLVEEVGEFGTPDSYFSRTGRMIRSSAMAMGGVDSFWRVSGERVEKHSLMKQEKPYRPGSRSQSYSAYSSKTAQLFTNHQSAASPLDTSAPAGPEQVGYRQEVRLGIGYSHPLGNHSQTLAMLMGPGLGVATKQGLAAIQVSEGLWLREAHLTRAGSLYYANGKTKHAVTGHKLIGDPQVIRTGHGLLVFLEPPEWAEATADCRSKEEASADVVAWLEKLSHFDGRSHPDDDLRNAVAVIKSALVGSVNEDEFANLTVAIRDAAAKPQLSRLLPDLLRNDPFWREQVQTLITKAVDLKRGEIDSAFADEIAEKESRLETLRRDVADAERRLTSAEERERAYRAGAEEVRTLIEEQVSVVTRDVFEPALKAKLKEMEISSDAQVEVQRLEARLAQIEQTSAVTIVHSSEQLRSDMEPSAVAVFASADQRSKLVRELHERTALGLGNIAFVLARMFGGKFPVLAGENADIVGVELAAMLGGGSENVIFCDPTKVTLSDLFEGRQSQGSVGAVVEVAKASPDAFVPLVLCGLTKSPCEFWLPALLDGRRTGGIPKNVVMLGTVAPDGIRIEVPKSVLKKIEPLEVEIGRQPPASQGYEGGGYWPIPDKSFVAEHRMSAMDMLISLESDGREFAEAVQDLSVVLSSADFEAADVADFFVQRQNWAKSLSGLSSEPHPLSRYFANFEG